ncbi:hypothetical protein SAE02_11140 [Skermanella aerolata]|uniref:Uncharacterized protein n=1 Tax=Skermanella aerolata TaxID=393310 RepID=A0A512DKG8_9PROT|nr:hypothetical protein SAE02_11140 [Skermanella aerolata]
MKTSRLSHKSASAPPNSENSSTGNAVADWTSATMGALSVIDVISHAAPTDCIQTPMLDISVASQIARNIG